MAWKGKNVVVLLDIGTARVSLVMAVFGPGRSFEVVAQDESPSVGVRKGVITDIQSVAGIIGNLLKNVLERVKINPFFVCAGFSGISVKVLNFYSRISLGSRRRIKSGDLSALMENARINGVPEGYVDLHILPVQYRLDGRAVFSPVNSSGVELEADMRLIVAEKKFIQAIYDVVRLAGIQLNKVIFTPLAEAPLLMNGAEMELGCVLVDLGAGTTTVAAFKYGMLMDAAVLPVGVEHVVGDLAVGLRTTIASARKLLRSISLVGREDFPETVEVAGTNGKTHRYDKVQVLSIIDARLQEICELVKQSIHSMSLTGFIPGGIKLTGGGSLLPGLAELFSRYVEMDVKKPLAVVSVPGGNECRVSLAGLLNYCSANENTPVFESSGGLDNIFNRLQSFISTGNNFLRRRGGWG